VFGEGFAAASAAVAGDMERLIKGSFPLTDGEIGTEEL
jgi:hypothetical protein